MDENDGVTSPGGLGIFAQRLIIMGWQSVTSSFNLLGTYLLRNTILDMQTNAFIRLSNV